MLGLGLGVTSPAIAGKRRAATPRVVLSAASVAEDASIGTVIGTLSVSNLGDLTVTGYAITADPDSKFAIDGDALETAATFDYETATSHSVTLTATLSDASTVERTFTISVTDVFEGTTVAAIVMGQSELEYLFNAGSFYRQITQPTPGNGNLIVYTQGAVDAAPVRVEVNPTTVAANQVNPSMAALSAFLDFAAPGVHFIVGDGAVAGTSRYALVDDSESGRKWEDFASVVTAMETEIERNVDVLIENWWNSDAASINTFKESFWPFYFGRTSADGAFTLGSTNPSAANATAVFDHCLWDAAAATSAKGRGILTRDDTKWRMITPMPFNNAPVAPAAELGYFSEGNPIMTEPRRANIIALAGNTLAQSVGLTVGPSSHLCRFGNGSSQIHPDVATADGQILFMWPVALHLLAEAGTVVSEPTIDAITGPDDGTYVEITVNLPNGGDLTTLRILRGGSAPSPAPPHYQDVVGLEMTRGSTRHPVYSDGGYSADYQGTVEIVDSGSGAPRKGKVRITPVNPFAFENSVSYLRGQATAVLLEDRDLDAQLYLDMLIEHIPTLHDDTALYPFEGVPVRPYQAELVCTVPEADVGEPYATTVSGGPYFVDVGGNVPANTTVIEYDLKVYVPSGAVAPSTSYLLASQESTGHDLFISKPSVGNAVFTVTVEDGDGTNMLSLATTGKTTVEAPLDQWFRIQCITDMVAGETKLYLDTVLVATLSFTPSPATFQSSREIAFLGTTAGATLAPIGTRFEYLEAWFTTSGVRTLRKRIAGDAAMVNADPWKAPTSSDAV